MADKEVLRWEPEKAGENGSNRAKKSKIYLRNLRAHLEQAKSVPLTLGKILSVSGGSLEKNSGFNTSYDLTKNALQIMQCV